VTTPLVTHAWLDCLDPSYKGEGDGCRRVERFLAHYGDTFPVILLDNGSSPETCERFAAKHGIEVVNLQPHLVRGEGHSYPSVWRLYWQIKSLLERYEKLYFLATDAYILSQRLIDRLEAINDGWTALWCPVYECPASEIQVITRGCREFENFFAGECNPDRFNGLWEEISLPFTRVIKGLWGDRFGEFKPTAPFIGYEPGMDFYSQVPDDERFDDGQFPVVRRIDGKVTVSGGYTVAAGGETSRIREFVLPFIKPGMMVLDLGFGADSICPTAINVDQAARYANMGNDPQHLTGDARNLEWFRDSVADVIYSSHLLEDFADPIPVLKEWLRVLKPGGILALYLPNEMRFRKVCAETGQGLNPHHSNPDMSLEYMRPVLTGLGLTIEFERDEPEGYGFLTISRKA